MRKKNFLFLLFLKIYGQLHAQVANGYALSVEPLNIQGFNGLQAFIAGQYDGKWVLLGGRTDGLHQRQPFASFLAGDNNTDIVVIAPATQQSWTTPLSSLSIPLQTQLQSTNMQFLQRGNTLYAIGGYGYSATAADHITHNKLTAIKVDSLILAVQNGTAISPYFRQISDSLFQITGGQLGKIGNDFYLVGGQVFTGRYNPMGPTHGPGFYQKYSNQIRKFQIDDDGTNLSISNVNISTDSINLHRRDYNMMPQIFAGNVEGFTVFSGVFQKTIDLPYLNSVDIFPTSHMVNNTFTQYLNHYHCAKVALYDSVNQSIENIFFGGISQYTDSAGVLVQDNNVPFTKAITKVSRNQAGNMTETKMGDLPHFLGSSAEFLVNHDLAMYENEIIKTNAIQADSVLLGYIVGGINSSQKNIFFVNTGVQSSASNMLYKVWLTKDANAVANPIPQHSVISQLQIFPNPSYGKIQLSYWLSAPIEYLLSIYDINGKLLKEQKVSHKTLGKQLEVLNIHAGAGTYLLTLKTEKELITRKIIIE